jgi:hypothetical protein
MKKILSVFIVCLVLISCFSFSGRVFADVITTDGALEISE